MYEGRIFPRQNIHTWAEYRNCLFDCVTHISGFLVVINMVDISGQAKVCYLHHIVLSHENITCRQVSMDTLNTHTLI